MKPPAWRQDRAVYPFSCAIQTRYTDEDSLGHINNISVAAYYDEARSRFSRHVFAKVDPAEMTRIVTADSRVTYLAEVFHKDGVEVCTGILRIGTASYEIGQAMYQDGRCVGICTTIFVQATPAGSSPLSASLKAVLQDMIIHAPPVLAGGAPV
ncbi:acyl-CoA thioesterase [Hyphomonas sp. NPDC076900]|uniref:acyl-CoA thioesterase n=1 Tax=unclassified Hyphomonas TaxID=2630699 RepID=UPI003CFC2FC2